MVTRELGLQGIVVPGVSFGETDFSSVVLSTNSEEFQMVATLLPHLITLGGGQEPSSPDGPDRPSRNS